MADILIRRNGPPGMQHPGEPFDIIITVSGGLSHYFLSAVPAPNLHKMFFETHGIYFFHDIFRLLKLGKFSASP